MTEIPELKDELTRKTFETIESLVIGRESGKITNLEYKMGIDTIFNICSGLVDEGFFALISQAAMETEKDYSFNRTRVFLRNETVKIITRKSNKDKFKVSLYTCKLVEKKVIGGLRDETDTNCETEEKLKELIAKGEANGFVEIM